MNLWRVEGSNIVCVPMGGPEVVETTAELICVAKALAEKLNHRIVEGRRCKKTRIFVARQVEAS